MSFPKNKIIITGEIGVGKSTLVQTVLAQTKIPFVCFQTSAILENRSVVGFELGELNSHEKVRFASLVNPSSPGLDKYEIDHTVFDKQGIRLLDSIQEQSKLIVLDELGIMEFNSPLFLKAIVTLFSSPKPIIAVIQQRALQKYLKLFQNKEFLTFHVTISNRNHLQPFVVKFLRDQMY